MGINVYRLANSEDLDEMTHIIRVYIVCYMYEKRDPQRKKCNSIWKLYAVTPLYKKWTIPKLMHLIRRKNPLSAFMAKTNT